MICLNLFAIANEETFAYLLKPNGGHILFVRNAIFYLMHRLFGAEPSGFFSVVLVTHLVNVSLLFWVIRKATNDVFLASFGAAVWGATPFNEGTLGWYSVYGQAFVAAVLLVILTQALILAARKEWPTRSLRVFWWVLALAAATSFGTGIALAMVLPLALFLLLHGNRQVGPWRAPLLSLLLIVPILYLALIWSYEFVSGEDVHSRGTYSGLGCNWLSNGVFFVRLIALGLTRLLLGFYAPSGDTPVLSYGLLVTLGLLCIWAGWRSRPTRNRVAAVFLLMSGCYGIIALARACILFDVSTDVLSAFSRYHYVGQLLLTVLVCIALQGPFSSLRPWVKGALLFCWYALAIVGYLAFASPINQFEMERRGTNEVLAAMRREIHAVPSGKTVRIRNRRFEPMPFLPGGWAAAFVIFFPENVVDGRRVLFVEKRPAVVAKLRQGRRTRSLVLGPGDS